MITVLFFWGCSFLVLIKSQLVVYIRPDIYVYFEMQQVQIRVHLDHKIKDLDAKYHYFHHWRQ